MPKLVTDAALNGLRAIGIQGMDTPVDIYPRVISEEPSDTVESWPTKSVTVLGWLRGAPTGSFGIDVGVVESPTPFRLFLPVGTAINAGDHVIIGGDHYSVSDTNQESTYQVMLTATLRKFEQM